MAIENTVTNSQQYCQAQQPVQMNQFGTQSLLSAEAALQPFPAPSPMSPPAPLDINGMRDDHSQVWLR